MVTANQNLTENNAKLKADSFKQKLKDMKTLKLSTLVLIVVLLGACKTTKVITPPKNITYKTLTNFKDYASIQVPVKGEFASGITLDTETSNEGKDRIYFYYKARTLNEPTFGVFFSNIKVDKKDDDLNTQLKKLQKKYGFFLAEPNNVTTKLLKIGNKNMLRFEMRRYFNGRIRSCNNGYLIENKDKTTFFCTLANVYTEEEANMVKTAFDEAFTYTVKTLKLKK